MSSTSKKIFSGSILGMVEILSTIVVTLLITPFIIRSLGDTMYGFWIFAASFLGFYGIMDLGLGSAVQRFVSRAIGMDDKNSEIKIVNTAVAVFSILGLVSLIVSVVIAIFVPLVVKNVSDAALFRSIILILGISCTIGFPLKVFTGIFSAHLRYDVNTSLALISLVVRTVLIVTFLNLGHGILSLALIMFSTDVVGYIAKYFIARRLYKHIVFSVKLIDFSIIKPLFGYSFYTFVAQIANELKFNVDNLVITAFIGLSAVTLYSIAARIVKYFILLVGRAVWLFIPVFSRYESRGDFNAIREKFIFTTKISSYFSILIGSIIIIFGKPFIEVWVGERFLVAYPILTILIIPLIFSSMQSPSIQVLYGISKHKFFAITNIVEGVVNLLLSLILVRKYGLVGVALGTAIPMLVIKLFIQPVYVCRIINLSIKKYYFSVLLPTMLNSGIVLLVFWFVARNFICVNYFNLAFFSAITIVFFAVCIFFLGFNVLERNSFKKMILKQQ